MPKHIKKEAGEVPTPKGSNGEGSSKAAAHKKESDKVPKPKGSNGEGSSKAVVVKKEADKMPKPKGSNGEGSSQSATLKKDANKMPKPKGSNGEGSSQAAAPKKAADKMPNPNDPAVEAGRQFPPLKKMTPQVRDELLRILRQVDRPLCLECLKDCRDFPERICTFQVGNQRCDGCAHRGVYCLKLLVNESRPCFRTIQKMAREITEHRMQNEGPVSAQMMEAYDTALDGALSFAEAVSTIKDLKEDRDKIAATAVRILQTGGNCTTEEAATQWAGKCGWELARLKRGDLDAAKRGGFVAGANLSASENMIKAFTDLREATAKRWLTEDSNIKLEQQLKEARAEIEELKGAKKRAEDARDTVVAELGNSKAAILAATTALERTRLEQATRPENMGFGNPFALVSQRLQPPQPGPAALLSQQATEADVLAKTVLHRLPSTVKNTLFRHIVAGQPGLRLVVWGRQSVGAKVHETVWVLHHLGKNLDFASSSAVLGFLRRNQMRVEIPGAKYRWSREDHAQVVNLCLVSREFMARVIRTQVTHYVRTVAATNTAV
ncbi:hypothetical protein MAPG_02909 [Magnaporthiopsis poae ATCC 64411]|uniref:Uncharacterized protein n=1 Tax=Magnaporthiopsis poae (strain ATCC 64411 / 73-15) TaxID=644358 RepID=A0A0C4DSM7_MAGP6|nr:hypothetical protein MAPG_02909 [Magnaporthiopsis poae ATCC 64411]